MPFKFERLEVWRLALDYVDVTDHLAQSLPRSEEYNLKTQLTRAATSIALNIAEGSQGQTDTEQARFLGMALRSLIGTVACLHLIHRRSLLNDAEQLRFAYRQAENLSAKLQAFRRTIAPDQKWLREEAPDYTTAEASHQRPDWA